MRTRCVSFVFAALAVLAALLAWMPHGASAATSSTLNFQARLMKANGQVVSDGDYNVEFKIYNAASSSGSSQGSCSGDAACLWTETRTSGNRVRVANGYLTVNLGSVTTLPSIDWDQELWISLNVGGAVVSPSWDGEMSPRLKLTAVPYAFRAGQLTTTNGSFRSTLGFVQPTANRTIQAPDESGTLCLQNSTACGFALASGAANYIQNQNSSDQTANFRISGTGRANTSFQAPLFDTAAAGTLNIGTTNATAISLNKATSVTGNLSQSGGTISLAATGTAGLSATGNLSLSSSGGTVNLTTSGANKINLTTGTSGVVVKPTTDNNAAFQVQNAAGGYVFSVDTSANTIGIGTLLVTTPTIFDGTIDTYFSGTLGIGTGTASVVNVGSAGATVTIQGNSSSVFKATSGSFTTTLGFTTPTANRAINLPNESGTVCLQGSSACSFAPASGSANYIQNATAAQSANFYVQAASSGSVAGVLRANAAGTGDILDLKNGAGTNVATFSSTGAVLLQNSTNSTAAFQVSASAGAGGNSILRVDSTNERVAIGVISDPIGAKLSVATSSVAGLRVFQGGAFDALQLGNATADFLTIGSTGNTLLKPTTNSSTAFRIQNANASTTVLAVDTSSARVAIGQASATYPLDVVGDINSSTGLRVAGTTVCDSTGCTAKSGSGFYIHNQTTVQSANMYVQAASSGSVAAIFQANAAGTGDILDLKNGAGTNVATVSSTGSAAFQNSTDSTTAFQVQSQSGGQMLGIDTQNSITNLHSGTSQLGTWKQTTSLPNSLRYTSSASANGFVYSVGGYETTARSVVSFAAQNADGSLGAWQSTTALPTGLHSASVVTANNYLYVIGGQTGSGYSNTVYYATINPSTGVVGTWNTTTVLPAASQLGSAIVANGYVYYVAGYNGSPLATVYYAQLNAGTGAVGAWTTSGNSLPATRYAGSLAMYNNYLYYTGGADSGANTVSTVYYASLNAGTGAVGTWTTSSNSLPATRALSTSYASNGYLYVFGGQDSSMTQYTTYYTKLGAAGAPGGWNAGTSLPSAVSQHGMAAYNGYVYIMGGYNGYTLSSTYYASLTNLISINADLVASGSLTLQANSNSNNALQVQNVSGLQMFNVNTSDNVVTINANGNTNGSFSAWGAPGVMPAALDGAVTVEVNGYTYVLGGYDGTNYLTSAYYTKTNGNGVLGPWKSTTSLPVARGFASGVALNGYIYVIGGNNNGTFYGTAYYAKVNLDGSLGAWQTSAAFPSSAVRAYGTAATANGYIYYLGGRGNGVYQSTTYYAKPNTDGSVTSWTAGTSLPALRSQHATVTANGYIYALGGTTDGTTAVSTSYYASLNAGTGAIGSWNTTTALPSVNMNLTAANANGYVYVMGGYNGSTVMNGIQYATLNADGTIGSWQTSQKSMPTGVSFGSALAASNNYLYMLGGYNGYAFLTNIYGTSLQGVVSVAGNLSVTGNASFQAANSTSAFQVQNASGGQMLNVDTVNNTITLNGHNSGALSAWQATSSLTTSTSFAGTTIANGFAYVFGGYGSGYQATVQVAKINPNGTMGTWTTTTALPAARAYVAAASSAGYIYVLGGTPGSGSVNTIYIGKQSPDGQVLSWQESSVTLPNTLNALSVVISNNFLYVIGGNNGTSPVSNTYYSAINGDGALNTFQTGTALPAASANGQALVSNGYIYYLGGYNGTSALATVSYATLDQTTGAIGSWTSTTSLPSTHNNFGATISNGYIYAYKTGSVNYAPITTNGSLGAWTQDTNSIPVNYNGISAMTYNGYNYVFGGYTGSVGTTGVYYTTGPRTYVAGTLDLVGLTMQGSGYADDTGGNGNAGGALIAGNTTVMGTMQVQGQSSFAQNVSVTGSLTVGGDTSAGDALITVASRGFSGIHLLGDMGNTGGEPGGAYVLYAQDAWGTQSITGMVQVADTSPQGDTYTGALANAFLIGMYNNFAVQIGTNANVRMTVLGNGNVCIAVTTCTKKLGVSGTIGASGTITASTTPDLAETIPAAPDVEAADVVMADPNNTERAVKSNRAYNTAAIGVISDGTSSFMINARANNPDAPLTGKPLVLVGRVPVKVTDEGGAIKPGDVLTTASRAGYAMKATKAGPTIGTALGSFNDDTGEVLVFVNLGYYNPSPGLQGDTSSVNYQNLNVSGDATINRLTVTGITVNGAASITGNLRVGGTVTTAELVIEGHIITRGTAPTISLGSDAGQGGVASVTGNDTSGVVSITVGAEATAGKYAKITFDKQYGSDPRIVLTAIGRNSAVYLPYIDYVNEREFMVGISQAVPSGTVLKYTYQVLQ